jgi:hypothetical protein
MHALDFLCTDEHAKVAVLLPGRQNIVSLKAES